MGLNQTAIATVIALMGATPLLHAETAAQPAPPVAESTTAAQEAAVATPTSDSTPPQTNEPAVAEEPALKASPIMGAEPAAQPVAPAATAPVQTKGDVLTLPAQPSATKEKRAPPAHINIEEEGMPGRGASMAQVEKHFGAPREKLPPVGDPPITRWIYGDYTVYFEYEYVIHSVRNREGAAPEPAAPATTTPAPAEPPPPGQ